MRKEVKLLIIVIVVILVIGIAIFAFSSNSNATYTADKEITTNEQLSGGVYGSASPDKNSILVNGKIKDELSGLKVNKTGDSAMSEQSSFYGMNSAILAKGGAELIINNIEVLTNANGANGIFCYGGSNGEAPNSTNQSANGGGQPDGGSQPPEAAGNGGGQPDGGSQPPEASGNGGGQQGGGSPNNQGSLDSDGTKIIVKDSSITTTEDQSGGIMVAGGGLLDASNLKIKTNGQSSAAIRSDRGGGNMTVDGGTYETTGRGSPAIYSTAMILVKNAELISSASEGVIIEGKNSIDLEKVTLTDTNNELHGKSTSYKNIFIYQSMSGDADVGQADFKATDSKITTNQGDTIYVTNTNAKIYLKNNEFVNNDDSGNFLRIQKDSWGTNGSNGGNVSLTLDNQKVNGPISVDSISSLNMTLGNNSNFEGVFKEISGNTINLHLDKTSKIKLTGDSYVSSLDDEVSDYSNIDFNGFKLYVNGKAIN
ncbi:MAG: hypothetical protein HUK28_04055 [Methanobrevibacter sp.]|nr:hypothetical protein [Methanobrevibacter sp.]